MYLYIVNDYIIEAYNCIKDPIMLFFNTCTIG